jgi:hypothetical protein
MLSALACCPLHAESPGTAAPPLFGAGYLWKAVQARQITFPFVKILICVNKTDSTAPKGTVTLAELPKK